VCVLRAQIVILHDSLFFTSSVPGQRYTLTVNASGVLRLQGAHRILLADVVFRRLQHSAARVLELENSQVRGCVTMCAEGLAVLRAIPVPLAGVCAFPCFCQAVAAQADRTA
jgi:hypothetical protein